MDAPDYLDQLAASSSQEWPAITRARQVTGDSLDKLSALQKFDTPSTAIVVTGSLGRLEATDSSDADWMLLVDGPSDPEHFKHLVDIRHKINGLGFRDPGRTDTFGTLVSSHELVHYIAGSHDSNENLTRRILLLSESRAITNPVLRSTVLRNILARYIVHDPAVPSGSERNKIPHFLLNDVVRYWRTMASDYASKMWERQHEGWAIRNVKLRFSRKLLFIQGLLLAFSFELWPRKDLLDPALDETEYLYRLADFILEETNVTPLDHLARVIAEVEESSSIAQSVIGSYDEFIAVLGDPEEREQLNKLPFESSDTSDVYNRLREASHQFRDGVNMLFFEKHDKLSSLIRKYGVF